MPELTEEEYGALDEYYTKNPPRIDPGKNGTGYFTKRMAAARTITLDTFTANYIVTKAIAMHKTPAEVVSDMVEKEMAVAL